MRLALTDFNKYGELYVVTTELNKEKFHRRKRENISIYFITLTSLKSEKYLLGTRVAIYLSARSNDSMYRMRESKSELELFHRLFTKHFYQIFLPLGLNTCLNRIWNYCYVYRSDLRWNRTLYMDQNVCLNLVKKDQLCATALMIRRWISKVLLKTVAMATSHSLLRYCFRVLTSTLPALLQN